MDPPVKKATCNEDDVFVDDRGAKGRVEPNDQRQKEKQVFKRIELHRNVRAPFSLGRAWCRPSYLDPVRGDLLPRFGDRQFGLSA
jgi:hypothetical protein